VCSGGGGGCGVTGVCCLGTDVLWLCYGSGSGCDDAGCIAVVVLLMVVVVVVIVVLLVVVVLAVIANLAMPQVR
jgi:hypothetical protein